MTSKINEQQARAIEKIATNRNFTSDEWREEGLSASLLRDLIDDGYIERCGLGFHPTDAGWDMVDDVIEAAREAADEQ